MNVIEIFNHFLCLDIRKIRDQKNLQKSKNNFGIFQRLIDQEFKPKFLKHSNVYLRLEMFTKFNPNDIFNGNESSKSIPEVAFRVQVNKMMSAGKCYNYLQIYYKLYCSNRVNIMNLKYFQTLK